ncbi:MAG: hypothetical protein RLZ45_1297 [Verrucomicrobiota bacterium]|jgi:hypothetical protein
MARLLSLLILTVTLGLSAARGAETRPSAPMPPAVRPSPTEVFRTLLSAPAAQREHYLSQRPQKARKVIEAKLREFEILPPEVRERRLQIAELQHFLLQVIGEPKERRPDLLAQTPAAIRPFVEDRLQAWDRLPPDRQQELLTQQRILASTSTRSTDTHGSAASTAPATPRSSRNPPDLQAALDRWQQLPAEERTRKLKDFQRFFDLSDQDQARVLGSVPAAERRQMEATLSQFSSLPPDQRARVIRGIRRYITLTAPERAQFVQALSQWQLMTPAERTTWRDLVNAVQPPPLPHPPRSRTFLVGTNTP